MYRRRLEGIKFCKAAGFNNPAGRALTGAVDLLEPVDAFNISVPRRQAAGLKADEMSTTIAPLEERGVSCSLDNYLVLPDHTMDARIAAARRELGPRATILGHHYQRDEVIRFADFRGSGSQLSY